jgi:uncharacterized protein (TIGR02145 family)
MKYDVKHLTLGFVIFLLILQSCRKVKETVPTLMTGEIVVLTWETAQGGGKILDEGSSNVFTEGVCWNTEINPTLADNRTWDFYLTDTSFYCYLYGLKPATKYYVRAFAINNSGIGYGNEISFSSFTHSTTVTAQLPAYIGLNSAVLNGIVKPDHIETIAKFEYGLTTSYGYVLPYGPYINGNDTSKIISALLSGLYEKTTYHYRIKAINDLGTTYSNDIAFTTLDKAISGTIFNTDLTYGSINDIDGNTYKTVQIGNQIWMAENLRTTNFNDGTPIPLMTGEPFWIPYSDPGYFWCYNDPANVKDTYGALYNWYAVSTGKLCPNGWHLPTDEEWTILTDYLGGEGIAGGKLKEVGTIHWSIPNTSATNLSGFSALPGGYVYDNIQFLSMGIKGFWWSSTIYPDNSLYALYRVMYNNFCDISRAEMNKQQGLSVRCIKDEPKK